MGATPFYWVSVTYEVACAVTDTNVTYGILVVKIFFFWFSLCTKKPNVVKINTKSFKKVFPKLIKLKNLNPNVLVLRSSWQSNFTSFF